MYDYSNISKGEMEENWGILFLTVDFSLPNQVLDLKCHSI